MLGNHCKKNRRKKKKNHFANTVLSYRKKNIVAFSEDIKNRVFFRPVYDSSFSPSYRGSIYTILFDTKLGAVMDFSRWTGEKSIIARLEI